MWKWSYLSRDLCASASTSSVDIAVMRWAVANGSPSVKLLGTDIDHRQVRDEFSGATGNLPAVRPSAETDIGYKSAKTRRGGFEFAQRLSALRHIAHIEPGLYKTLLSDRA